MACDNNKATKETIFHSDQGSEYASKEYRKVLEQLGLRISMSRKGHCWDNAHMESFFHTKNRDGLFSEIPSFGRGNCLHHGLHPVLQWREAALWIGL